MQRERWITLLAAVALSATAVRGQQASNARPNIVLIITDDVGYGDFGSYGAPDIKTPNIDRLAREGVRMTDFYANGATCTPTRAGLVSGRYQQRFALERPLGSGTSQDSATGLPATGRSLPQLLTNSGYATALVGKWHLGYKPELVRRRMASATSSGSRAATSTTISTPAAMENADLFENEKPVAVAAT